MNKKYAVIAAVSLGLASWVWAHDEDMKMPPQKAGSQEFQQLKPWKVEFLQPEWWKLVQTSIFTSS